MPASLYVEVPSLPPVEILLDEEVVTVGRAETNTLSLRDMNVSRHHFSLELRHRLGYVLQDQGSRNGTVVNNATVLNKVLVEGDRIQVGGSVLTFRAQASPNAVPLAALRPQSTPHGGNPRAAPSGFGMNPAPRTVPTGQQPPLSRPTLRNPGQHTPAEQFTPPVAIPRRSNTPTPTPTPSPDLGHDPATSAGKGGADTRWRKLAEVACALNIERDPAKLLETILDAVLSLVPSKSAFLVICQGDDLVVKAHRNAPDALVTEGTEAARMSRQVCREALEKGKPVLTQDAVSDDELSEFLTVIKLQLKSILCVPIVHKEEALGVVYLDEPSVDPFDEDGEAVSLVGAFGDLAGIAMANVRLLADIATKERLEEELRIAARIQRTLLPNRPPPAKGLEIAGRTLPAREVGGDIYDFFRRREPTDDVLISIGDVAGKGVGAGMVMATTRALLHAFAGIYQRTDEVLLHLNRVLAPDLDSGIFVSFLLLRYTESTGLLHYTGAGHEHLILYRPATGQLETLRAGGVVLGLLDDMTGKIHEKELKLQRGDVVCLYTDGATEAVDADGEEFELERLAQAVKTGSLEPEAIVERCMNTVLDYAGRENDMHDDLTIVAFRKT